MSDASRLQERFHVLRVNKKIAQFGAARTVPVGSACGQKTVSFRLVREYAGWGRAALGSEDFESAQPQFHQARQKVAEARRGMCPDCGPSSFGDYAEHLCRACSCRGLVSRAVVADERREGSGDVGSVSGIDQGASEVSARKGRLR